MVINQGWPIKRRQAKYNFRVWLQLDSKRIQMVWDLAANQSWICSVHVCVYPLFFSTNYSIASSCSLNQSSKQYSTVEGFSPFSSLWKPTDTPHWASSVREHRINTITPKFSLKPSTPPMPNMSRHVLVGDETHTLSVASVDFTVTVLTYLGVGGKAR